MGASNELSSLQLWQRCFFRACSLIKAAHRAHSKASSLASARASQAWLKGSTCFTAAKQPRLPAVAALLQLAHEAQRALPFQRQPLQARSWQEPALLGSCLASSASSSSSSSAAAGGIASDAGLAPQPFPMQHWPQPNLLQLVGSAPLPHLQSRHRQLQVLSASREGARGAAAVATRHALDWCLQCKWVDREAAHNMSVVSGEIVIGCSAWRPKSSKSHS